MRSRRVCLIVSFSQKTDSQIKMKTKPRFLLVVSYLIAIGAILWQGVLCHAKSPGEPKNDVIRIATYNVAMYRDVLGELRKEVGGGYSGQASRIAEVIRRVRPDVILINEIDYEEGSSHLIDSFKEHYLEHVQKSIAGWPKPLDFPYHFYRPVNTGIDSGLDLDLDGKLGGPEDAFGYGKYPGQYGMLLLSRFPIIESESHTFQKLLWKDYPSALLPIVPSTGKPYYSDALLEKFRLPSKSFWDVCVLLPCARKLHVLCSHPTPPAFDGPEDRNGCRNYDEIGLVARYITGGEAVAFLKNDAGQPVEGIGADKHCVVLGDLNADPVDGNCRPGAIQQLLEHPFLRGGFAPSGEGGKASGEKHADLNGSQKGDSSHDTSDFSGDNFGNLRVDYVIPSRGLNIIDGGVYWPKRNEPGAGAVKGSDHRLVWLDLKL